MNHKHILISLLFLSGLSRVAGAAVTTTTSLNASPNPAILGGIVTLTATVSPGSATGKVTFYDGSAVLGATTLASGSASLTTWILAAGPHKLTARYDGSVASLASLSAPFAETVSPEFAGSLVAASALTAGSNPDGVALGDFNHDGKADLVVTNQFSGNVSVFLGNGSGGFSGPTNYSATLPSSVVVADFNGDGIQDFAVAEFSPANVQIFLGKGDGTFQTGPTVTPGLGPSAIVAADFNSDGIVDLATTNTGDSEDRRISIMIGNGDGSFQAETGLTVSGLAKGLVVGDFNGDGHPDLATTCVDVNTVNILIGIGDGTFESDVAYAVGASPFGVTAADFNKDGILDLAVANSGGEDNPGPSNASILLGNGDGTFKAATTVGSFSGAQAIAVGDFNADGVEDLAVTDYGANSVAILPGVGNGTFYAGNTFSAGGNPAGLVVADFNGDGKSDVAAVDNNSTPNVSILIGGPAVVSALLGSSQVANLGSAFAVPFEAQATAFGAPVPGTTITFTAPASGVTGTFSGTGSTAVETTAADGTAVAPTFVANGLSGYYQVAATSAVGGSAAFNVANSSASCLFTVSTAALAADSTGGTQNVTITANGPSCAYVTSSDSNWLTVSPLGGGSSGTLSITATTNTSGADRTGHITAGGNTITFTQDFTAQKFTDVAPGIYYFDAVNLLAGLGITTGCGPTTYCPTQAITREEMAVFIVRTVYDNGPFPYSQIPYFTDVPASNFYFSYIQAMYELGITTGCGPSLFCPTSPVTRDQMAVFIIRARYGATTVFTYPQTPYFTDVPPTDFAFIWVQRMAYDQITNGCAVNLYCPASSVIRGDMAVFIMRGGFNELLPANDPLITAVTPNTLTVGASDTFTVTGVNTSFVQGVTTVVPVNNLQVSNLTVLSPTQFTVTLTAPQGTLIEPASIYVQTGAQEAVYPNAINVSAQ